MYYLRLRIVRSARTTVGFHHFLLYINGNVFFNTISSLLAPSVGQFATPTMASQEAYFSSPTTSEEALLSHTHTEEALLSLLWFLLHDLLLVYCFSSSTTTTFYTKTTFSSPSSSSPFLSLRLLRCKKGEACCAACPLMLPHSATAPLPLYII